MQAVRDKTVIVLEILPGAERPYYIKSQGMFEGTYVRVAGTTRHVEDYMLKELILEGKNRYFDSEICQNMKITDGEIEELCKSMKETAIRNTWQDSEKAKIKDVTKNVLISWGVLKEEGGNVYPTNAYALLTGRMFQQPVIQCGVFKGINRAHFVDRREFEGSIQEQMEAAYQYVLEKINMGMTIKGMYRQDVYELPTDSIRELIANAVAHRSYLEPGNIQVALYDNRLEITSPGMLLNNVTIAKMMEGYSKPRNPAIARAFAYMKIIEKWGTGIPRLFEACEEYGLPKPELIDFDGDFRVNLYRKKETDTEINEKIYQRVNDVIGRVYQRKNEPQNEPQNDPQNEPQNDPQRLGVLEEGLLNLIRQDGHVTRDEMASQMKVSLSTVKRSINKLKDNGLIEYEGSSKSGYWIIKQS
jgi:ATP-dependent DNA helicase RecG